MTHVPFHSEHVRQDSDGASSPRENVPLRKGQQSAWAECGAVASPGRGRDATVGGHEQDETSTMGVESASTGEEVVDGAGQRRASERSAGDVLPGTPSQERAADLQQGPGKSRWSAGEESSPDRSRSATSQSDTRSYRDRLRERFLAVKEHVGSSVVLTEGSQTRARGSRHRRIVRSTSPRSDHQRPGEAAIVDFFTCDAVGTRQAEPDAACEQGVDQVLPTLKYDQHQLAVLQAANYTSRSQQAAEERSLLCFLSSTTVGVQQRLEQGCTPRYLEQEGLYVGAKPRVSRRNTTRLERRLLLSHNHTRWFGEDGEVASLADPRHRAASVSRLGLYQAAEARYMPAASWTSAGTNVLDDSALGARLQLELQVWRVVFSHHPLFSKEHVLAARLQDTYQRYARRLSLDQHARLANKLAALRAAHDRLARCCQPLLPEQQARLRRYEQELVQMHSLCEQEGKRDRQLLQQLLCLWRDLRQLRQLQGYTSTSVCVHIWQEEPARELSSQCESAAVQGLEERLRQCVRPPAEPLLHVQLDHSMPVDHHVQDNKEKLRRDQVTQCRLYLKVFFDDAPVCQSKVRALDDTFTLHFEEVFPLCIVHPPHTFKLELHQLGGLVKSTLVAQVFVPVPHRVREGADVLDAVQRLGVAHVSEVRRWLDRSCLDPNHPSNASLFNIVKMSGTEVQSRPDYFRLDPAQSQFELCSWQDVDLNPRLRLLRLRHQGCPWLRAVRMLPLREKEIPHGVLSVLDKRQQEQGQQDREAPGAVLLDVQRAKGYRFLLGVRRRILSHSHLARQQPQLVDVVSEHLIPDIGTLGAVLARWVRAKRPLRPARKERRPLAIHGPGEAEVQVVVTVVQAFQVPRRVDQDMLRAVGDSPPGRHVLVRPFVQACFQGHSARTVTAEGCSPTWHQELRLPVRLGSTDCSSDGAAGWWCVREPLALHMFDEVQVDLAQDQLLECVWLGCLQIPFPALCFNTTVEGTSRLQCPAVLLGYQRESRVQVLTRDDATYLTLFVTLQPALGPPKPVQVGVESLELAHVQQRMQAWQQQAARLAPGRCAQACVVDTSGRTVCVTRFVRPLSPPVIDAGVETTAEMAARFVSLIPVKDAKMQCAGLFDVWLTADQVLRLLAAEVEDLAVLLCCYFLHLGKQAWVLLGVGVHRGPTAYVMTLEDEEGYLLWDPASGQHYQVTDTFCPLHTVYCLLDDSNVWANVQGEELPCRTRYDTSRGADWLPLFDAGVAAPGCSVQPAMLEYTATSAVYCKQLRDSLEKHLRDSLMLWRADTRTSWNSHCSAVLRRLLPALEEASWIKVQPPSADNFQQLHHILASHKMCGFPLNMAYEDKSATTAALRATGVHLSRNPRVEFALAVHVHPYPCGVLSLWLYVASLVKRR